MTEEEFLRVLDVVDAVHDSADADKRVLPEGKYWWRAACDKIWERLRTEFEGKLT